MRIVDRNFSLRLPLTIACFVFVLAGGRVSAQSQLPLPSGHINDSSGVIDAQTKSRLENILVNLQDKTKVEFYVAIVDGTNGLDLGDFARKLSTEWNIGAMNSGKKSLLLVVSISDKSSITQYSKLVLRDLPEGILGDIKERMRSPLIAGRFSQAIDEGVMVFSGALAQKHGFPIQDLEKSTVTAEATPVASTSDTQQTADTPKTRRRVVTESQKPTDSDTNGTTDRESKPSTIEVAQPSLTTETKPEETKAAATKEAEKTAVVPKPKPSTRNSKNNASTRKTEEQPPPPVDDEAEAEEVELTLTLPLTKRAEKLKSFLETHPESKARPRATELLISTHAGLGDQYLKAGDAENGIKHLMLAIDEANVSISDQLFFGVISQIPSNLYLRGQADSALKAANTIETKFGSDPKRLLMVAGFFLGIERGDEAGRIAEQVVKTAPDLAEAHRVLALSNHINLQLDEAAAEYKKTIELDPNSKASQISLAHLLRASGKPEEALAIYDEVLKADSKDRGAEAGRVISLFELGRKDEANSALEAALTNEPRNLALLAGMGYWFAAHGDYEKAFDYSRKAIEVEPRYTWAQIALVRSLIGLKRPLGAERAMRFARQYGKFPTLNYELATVLATMGLYDEAAEILRESFGFKEGQIETYLAGHISAHDESFTALLAPERKASIYQPTAADSASNSKVLRDLLALDSSLNVSEADKVDENAVAKAAAEFGSGDDSMKAFRQLYAATRLLRKTVALPTALRLVEQARRNLDEALNVPVATTAVQAEELRELRANALASGTVPDMAEAPRNALDKIIRGRIEDLTGWILFNQDKFTDAIDHLKRATTTLPYGTPAWRNATWHLGVAYEQTGSNSEALENYINSYNSGVRDPLRRTTIEKLYRKVNGSLTGLDEKIGPSPLGGSSSNAEATSSTETSSPAATTPSVTEKPADRPVEETIKPETTSSSSSSATPTPAPAQTSTPVTTEPLSEEALKAAASRIRSNIKITGRVLDSSQTGMSNVVVVLISPSGSVISAMTDNEGRYSFTVIPSQREYRLIPSKSGYTFTPVEKTFPGLLDDQKAVDFVAVTGRP